jgi:hypothetical protein
MVLRVFICRDTGIAAAATQTFSDFGAASPS